MHLEIAYPPKERILDAPNKRLERSIGVAIYPMDYGVWASPRDWRSFWIWYTDGELVRQIDLEIIAEANYLDSVAAIPSHSSTFWKI